MNILTILPTSGLLIIMVRVSINHIFLRVKENTWEYFFWLNPFPNTFKIPLTFPPTLLIKILIMEDILDTKGTSFLKKDGLFLENTYILKILTLSEHSRHYQRRLFERSVGFEPTVPLQYASFQDQSLKPLDHPSKRKMLNFWLFKL